MTWNDGCSYILRRELLRLGCRLDHRDRKSAGVAVVAVLGNLEATR